MFLFDSFHNKEDNFYNKKSLEKISTNYSFTKDNFIKMTLILIKLEAKIPVIIMGKSGYGNSLLIQKLFDFVSYGNFNNLKVLDFYPGIKIEEIINFFNLIISEEENLEKKDNTKFRKNRLYIQKNIWIFLKNINYCKSMGLIKELICEHSLLGKQLNKNITIISTYNSKFYKENDSLKTNEETGCYKYYPIPNSIKNFVLNFDEIDMKVENIYIDNIINSSIEKINNNLNNEKLEEIKKLTKNLIIKCHKFIKENYNKLYISLRDVARIIKFYEFFYNYLKMKKEKKINNMNKGKTFEYNKFTEFDFHIYSINLSIYICYYLKIPNKILRIKLNNELNKLFKYNDFLSFPKNEQNFIINNMEIPKEIEINNNLLENIFSLFFAINTKTSIFIVDNKNNDKLISLKLLYKSMKGLWSNNLLIKLYPKILLYSYQELIDIYSEQINKMYLKINNFYGKLTHKNYSVIYFDGNEIKMPFHLLKSFEEKNIIFVGISNIYSEQIEINNVLYIRNPEC